MTLPLDGVEFEPASFDAFAIFETKSSIAERWGLPRRCETGSAILAARRSGSNGGLQRCNCQACVPTTDVSLFGILRRAERACCKWKAGSANSTKRPSRSVVIILGLRITLRSARNQVFCDPIVRSAMPDLAAGRFRTGGADRFPVNKCNRRTEGWLCIPHPFSAILSAPSKKPPRRGWEWSHGSSIGFWR